MKYYYTTNSDTLLLATVGMRDSNGTATGMLQNVNSLSLLTQLNTTIRSPYFSNYNSSKDVDDLLLSTLNFLATLNPRSVFRKTPQYLYSLPDANTIFNNITASNIDYTVQVNDNSYFQRYSYVNTDSAIILNRARLVSNVNGAYVKNATKKQIAATISPLPFSVTQPTIDIILLVTAALMPAAISFLMPIFSYTLVMEKEKKLREMMKIMGMNSSIYWLVNYLFDFALYVVVCLAFIVVQLMFQARLFMQTSPLLLFLLLFLWGQCIIAAAFLISTVFSRASGASLFGYLLNILSMVASFVLCTTVYDQNTFPAAWFWIYPYFCFYRVIFLMVINCSQLNCIKGFDYSQNTWYGGDIGLAFFCIAMETIFMAVLAWYLNKVIPQEFGIAEHPLFFLKPIKKAFVFIFKKLGIKSCGPCLGRCIKTAPAEEPQAVEDQNGFKRDPSVILHEQEIVNGVYDDEPLVIDRLVKRYKGGKLALKGLTFAVRRGECYGLLGPNGAGKSTMMSILYGLFPPTSGSASVAGFNLDRIPDIQRNIGVSMQFDVLWESLTVREHLNFYARLKGVADTKKHVEDLIEAVSLNHKANAYAGSLSGGMKRRLSLAIAMIGSPSVVFLDEPTTGLDPQSKRHVWKCISAFQRGRAMVLTTHDMDEASALCKRYGVLCQGELRFNGSQEDLRRSFMHLYRFRLDLTFDSSRRDDVVQYITGLAPGEVTLLTDEGREQAGKLSFGLSANVQVGDIWAGMEQAKQQGVDEWAVGQMSLETLFIKLVYSEMENDKKRPPVPPTLLQRFKKLFSRKTRSSPQAAHEVNVEMAEVTPVSIYPLERDDAN
jgi:ABC-type multidrug transport system ATPase subunit